MPSSPLSRPRLSLVQTPPWGLPSRSRHAFALVVAGLGLLALALPLRASETTAKPAAASASAAAPGASAPRGPTSMRPQRRPLRAAPAASAPAPSATASAPAGRAAGAAGAAIDPLDRLRERLTRELSAEKTYKGSRRSPPVMRVENQAPGEFRLQASSASARAAAGSGGAAGAGHGSRRAGDPAAGSGGHGPAWAYSGPLGPQAWPTLHPSFSLCGSGQRQSPIDIRDGLPLDLESVDFDYRPGFFSVTDNGHTVNVQVGAGNAIEVGARRYELTGFHFHMPGEERVDGRSFALSVHLVHRDAQGRLAVVALVAEEGPENPAVQTVWNHLPLERGEFVAASVEFNPAALLPQRRGYFTYMGSLTTPPCTEGVLWIVMQQPIQVSPQQLAIFARLHPMNARPVQPLNDRVIKQSR